LAFNHIVEIGILLQWQREHGISTVLKKAVPIDPAFFCVFDVVVDDKNVNRTYELEIADVGQEVRLHYCQFHWYHSLLDG